MPELITVSNKGQITIPLRIRKQLMIRSGDKMYCDVMGGTFVCNKPADFFSLKGCLGKVEIPENEEELFIDAAANHVSGNDQND
ncbi:MAG: AbrB/MazE/SpoVT family DNA-binding domain-containing protein [Synergistaceae bacterium]|jgi:AbrB family looped-hinge helix DNA binding protein|nr:AbrB/MazE/SpoVT family DNA-binding domain-containing protein [Synergistaceae bacterium]